MNERFSKIRLFAAMLCFVGSLFVAVSAAEAYESVEDVSVEEVIKTESLKKLETIAESLRRSKIRRQSGFHAKSIDQLSPQHQTSQLRMNCRFFTPTCERQNHNGLGTYLLA